MAKKQLKPAAKSATKSTKTVGKSPAADAKKAFASAIAGADKQWKEARKNAATGDGFSPPNIDDGNYFAQVKELAFGAKDGKPWARVTFTVLKGDFEGTEVSSFNMFKGRDGKWNDIAMQSFCKMIRRLGFDVDEFDLSEMPELAETINGAPPYCQIAVKNRVDNNGNPQINVYVNKQLDEDGDPI